MTYRLAQYEKERVNWPNVSYKSDLLLKTLLAVSSEHPDSLVYLEILVSGISSQYFPADDLLDSLLLSAWQSIDVVRRSKILITRGNWNLSGVF